MRSLVSRATRPAPAPAAEERQGTELLAEAETGAAESVELLPDHSRKGPTTSYNARRLLIAAFAVTVVGLVLFATVGRSSSGRATGKDHPPSMAQVESHRGSGADKALIMEAAKVENMLGVRMLSRTADNIVAKAQGRCKPECTNSLDDGHKDDFQGWYDVQNCGRCYDYCRWVGGATSGGNPNKTLSNGSWWSCRLAGTNLPYTGQGYFTSWPHLKCSGEGAENPLRIALRRRKAPPEAMDWEVAESNVVQVRSGKSESSEILGSLAGCAVVHAHQEGEWLNLADKTGYVKIWKDGEALLNKMAVWYQTVETGTCEDAGLFPITNHTLCAATAPALGLRPVAPAISPREGHGECVLRGGIVLGLEDTSKHRNAGTVPVCSTWAPCELSWMKPKLEASEDASAKPAAKDSTGHDAHGQKASGSRSKAEGCPACAPSNPTFSVIMPVYERDLCKFNYTARSISKFDPHHILGDVYIMWVSTQPAIGYKTQLDEIKDAISKTRKVHLKDYSQQVASANMGGWFAQQILKLKIAADVPSDYYVVLDSKNTLVNEVKEDTFLSKCNQGFIYGQYKYDEIPPPHLDWYKASAQALNVPPLSSGHWPASTTPIVLHTKTVLKMLQSIGEGTHPNQLCEGPLCGMFNQGGHGATEFTMYLVYAASKTDIECIHSVATPDPKRMWANMLWRGLPYNLAICKDIATGKQEPLTFGGQASSQDSIPWDKREDFNKYFVKIFEDAGLYKPSGDHENNGQDQGFIECIIGHE